MLTQTIDDKQAVYKFVSGADWITITISMDGGGKIESNLKHDNPQGEDEIAYNHAVDGMEHTLLALACDFVVDFHQAENSIQTILDVLGNI